MEKGWKKSKLKFLRELLLGKSKKKIAKDKFKLYGKGEIESEKIKKRYKEKDEGGKERMKRKRRGGNLKREKKRREREEEKSERVLLRGEMKVKE